jgi:hypothetical protein
MFSFPFSLAKTDEGGREGRKKERVGGREAFGVGYYEADWGLVLSRLVRY